MPYGRRCSNDPYNEGGKSHLEPGGEHAAVAAAKTDNGAALRALFLREMLQEKHEGRGEERLLE